MIPPTALTFLEAIGAGRTPHTGRTLLAHLAGTYRLLAAWGNPEAVCLAGLFHSVYGTQTFPHRSVGPEARGRVREVIGGQAEALAYLFGACDRDRLFADAAGERTGRVEDRVAGREVPVGEEALRALFEIELANDLEQWPRRRPMSAVRRQRWATRWEAARQFLSASAAAALDEAARGGPA